jgi:hypothetical protein
MSTAKKHADVDMLPEYDFSKAVRGKYYARFKQSYKQMQRARPAQAKKPRR